MDFWNKIIFSSHFHLISIKVSCVFVLASPPDIPARQEDVIPQSVSQNLVAKAGFLFRKYFCLPNVDIYIVLLGGFCYCKANTPTTHPMSLAPGRPTPQHGVGAVGIRFVTTETT
jgi:hypothetical protein